MYVCLIITHYLSPGMSYWVVFFYNNSGHHQQHHFHLRDHRRSKEVGTKNWETSSFGISASVATLSNFELSRFKFEPWLAMLFCLTMFNDFTKKSLIFLWTTCEIQQLYVFVYLGSLFTKDGKAHKDIEWSVNAVNSIIGGLGGNKKMSKEAKLAVHNVVVIPILLYGNDALNW